MINKILLIITWVLFFLAFSFMALIVSGEHQRLIRCERVLEVLEVR